MNRATATAAPSVVTINKKEYRRTPLTASDWGEWERWLQDRQFDIASRNLDKLQGDDRDRLIQYAHNKASSIAFTDAKSTDVLQTYEGAVKLSWMSLRHEHPSITLEEVGELLLDPSALSLMFDTLPLGLPEESGGVKKKRAGNKADARKKKKKKRKARKT